MVQLDSEVLAAAAVDLHDEVLAAQRFQILADIAEELTGTVICPLNFEVTLKIRQLLRQDCAMDALYRVVRLDPLICSNLLRAANSKARRRKLAPMSSIAEAFTFLDADLIRKTTGLVAANQLLRSRCVAEFATWTEQLWGRTLDMAASARVVAGRLTVFDPDEAMFNALCGDLGLYYMLYRAAQYPDLLAHPDTVKHLVLTWHGGIVESLLDSLKLPQTSIDAVCHEPKPPIPSTLETPRDVFRASRALAGAVFDWNTSRSGAKVAVTDQVRKWLPLEDEIRACRMELLSVYRPQS